MRTLTGPLLKCGLMLSALLLVTGCATNAPLCTYNLPPIYPSVEDVLTDGTVDQLLRHNCKTDYQPKLCKEKE